jgi:hypothetical protein
MLQFGGFFILIVTMCQLVGFALAHNKYQDDLLDVTSMLRSAPQRSGSPKSWSRYKAILLAALSIS